jgi:AraC-like DNA-binding protein
LPVQVEDAARLCKMSGSRFMSFFKATTGQSFHAYLNRFRVAKAQLLLTTTDKPLDSISQETGFCDQSYFGMVFRKLVGISPRVYRRRLGKLSDVEHVPTAVDGIVERLDVQQPPPLNILPPPTNPRRGKRRVL